MFIANIKLFRSVKGKVKKTKSRERRIDTDKYLPNLQIQQPDVFLYTALGKPA